MSVWWCVYREHVASRRSRFHVVSPPGPKKSARMLLSTPWTSKPRRSKNSTASDPMSPALPVTRTFTSPGHYRVPCQTPRAMRVAVTLEQCWHQVPGGTARATLDTIDAIRERGDVAQVGVSARHRSPAPAAWQPSIDVRPLPLPRIALYDVVAAVAATAGRARDGRGRRRPLDRPRGGCVDRADGRDGPRPPLPPRALALHEARDRGVHPVPRPRARRGGRGRVPVRGHPYGLRGGGHRPFPPARHPVGHPCRAGAGRRGRPGAGGVRAATSVRPLCRHRRAAQERRAGSWTPSRRSARSMPSW